MVAVNQAPEYKYSAKTQSLLDQLLEGKDPEFQRSVLRYVVKTGVKESDFIFVIMLACGHLQVLLERSPKELTILFDTWSDQLYAKIQLLLSETETALKERQNLLVRAQETAIAHAVSSLLVKTSLKQATNWKVFLPASGMVLGLLALGTGIGVFLTQPKFDPSGLRQLTLDQANDLRWAESHEGKKARQIYEWNNSALQNLQCKKDLKDFRVTLEVNGHKAVEGYCVLWVEEPGKRLFDR